MDQDWQAQLLKEKESLEKDNEALRAELKSGNPDLNNSAAVVKNALLPEVPYYVAEIDALARSADSEGVRLQANKLLIEWALTDKLNTVGTQADDTFKNLLLKIQAKNKQQAKTKTK